MTATYQNHGVQFIYPENWKLIDQEDPDQRPCQIALESPSGGQWSVILFPTDRNPDEVLAEAVQALGDQYEDLETSAAPPDFEPYPSTAVDGYFYCLDFMVMARLRVIETAKYTLLVWFQAESRDFDTNHQVFRAITTSLLKSIG